MDDDIDRERERRALFAEFERDGDLVAERSERNSWIHEWRRVIAEADRADDRADREKIIDDSVRRLKADLERRFPKRK